MACGLAPVAAAASGPSTVLEHARTGLLVPPRDVDACVGAVERLIADPALLLRLRRNAHAAAQRYSWDTTVAERLALIELAHAGRSGFALALPGEAPRHPWSPSAHRAPEPAPEPSVEPDVEHEQVA